MLGKKQDKEGQEAGITNRHEDTLGSDRYGHYLDRSKPYNAVKPQLKSSLLLNTPKAISGHRDLSLLRTQLIYYLANEQYPYMTLWSLLYCCNI